MGDRPRRLRAAGPARAARARLRLPEPPRALARGGRARRRGAERGRPPHAGGPPHAAGRAERELLDARSDELARSLLEPLTAGQRERLAGAMREVERLLTAALVEIAPADPAHPDARRCLAAYFDELDRRDEAGFDPVASDSPPPRELRPPHGVLCCARLRGEPVGCGGLKGLGRPACEIKRMWVDDAVRGLGIGRRLLAELEGRAARRAPRPSGSRPTATSPRPSPCTPPGTRRCRRSTTSRSRTTGSRSGSDVRRRRSRRAGAPPRALRRGSGCARRPAAGRPRRGAG